MSVVTKNERRSAVQTPGSSRVDIFSTPPKGICLHRRIGPGPPFPFGDQQLACPHIGASRLSLRFTITAVLYVSSRKIGNKKGERTDNQLT